MPNVKKKMTEVIQSRPQDVTHKEIVREPAFEKMAERRLSDSRNGRIQSPHLSGPHIVISLY